ncbi:hypothetical protein N7499_006301 [Penicillium canescens]|uniref:Uncharacterized protein n=1 Tax=Penicillium canescens TaxID=5083 RepID=A0AAD6NBS0_PENCN|nr:uncharacterized protein N7446_005612 [Penicillium canescens]KAJ6050145.1 hypothetical protein N7444_006861 [Penicillium canescens]KAJ6050984.1 hypothetical protein N7460_001518 [Penicillium canescens]KAJ6061492.1 hypothetical protein N7446_005612 [Penicillium canescens]KAJ6081427.1 hypothetical protein N7499_006301 [Penicillium canescens]KAJ6176777.1 hypothetical protein N7485_003691 [Penicillium canescens]
MASYRPPTPSPRTVEMDHPEILRTIATLNARSVRAEKIIAKYERELAIERQSHRETNKELYETSKVAELLYNVNRKLGSATDYILKQQGMSLDDLEPKSVEALINSLVQQGEDVARPTSEANGERLAGSAGTCPGEMNSTTM